MSVLTDTSGNVYVSNGNALTYTSTPTPARQTVIADQNYTSPNAICNWINSLNIPNNVFYLVLKEKQTFGTRQTVMIALDNTHTAAYVVYRAGNTQPANSAASSTTITTSAQVYEGDTFELFEMGY